MEITLVGHHRIGGGEGLADLNSSEDFLNLARYRIYRRLMVNGVMFRPFGARTYK